MYYACLIYIRTWKLFLRKERYTGCYTSLQVNQALRVRLRMRYICIRECTYTCAYTLCKRTYCIYVSKSVDGEAGRYIHTYRHIYIHMYKLSASLSRFVEYCGYIILVSTHMVFDVSTGAPTFHPEFLQLTGIRTLREN